MQLVAPALLLSHLREFHSAAGSGKVVDAVAGACEHAGHSSPTEPARHDHHDCVVCQLAMHVQVAGLAGVATTLPQIAVLPVTRPAPSLAAPDCAPSFRLPDICGPPAV